MASAVRDDAMMLEDLESDDDIFLDCKESLTDDDSEEDLDVDNFFNKLPDEIIVKIFSFLSRRDLALRVAMINKRFHDLSLVPSLWQTVHIPVERSMSLTEAHKLLERCSMLKHLFIKRRLDSEFIAIYALEYCPRLERLELVYCEKPSVFFLEAVGEFGLSLRNLNLWGTSLDPELLNSGQCLSRLTHLDLFNCKGLTDSGLREIADNCKSLQYFNMEEVTLLSDDAMNYFIDGVQNSIRDLLIDGESLTDNSFKHLSKCKRLEKLGVTFADSMESDGLQAISRLSRLKWLKVRRGKSLNDSDFVRAFKEEKLKNLTNLDLSECAGLEDRGMDIIAHNCPDLVYLTLDWCWELTDESIR